MTEIEAKKIGSKQGLLSVGIGLFIAQLIMTLFSSDFFWFTDASFKLNLAIGIMIMLTSGHIFGQLAGKAILIKKRNYVMTGFSYGMAVLMTTTFLSSWVGFFQEGGNNIGTNDNPFEDYILKPVFWIFLFGLIPSFLVGIWFGKQIKKNEKSTI
jgi:hypothetical protein